MRTWQEGCGRTADQEANGIADQVKLCDDAGRCGREPQQLQQEHTLVTTPVTTPHGSGCADMLLAMHGPMRLHSKPCRALASSHVNQITLCFR